MTQPPVWANNYIGIPFVDKGRDHNGCDCWGLVRLILDEQAGIKLPVYNINPDEEIAITQLFEDERLSGSWKEIAPGKERMFDVVEMLSPSLTGTGWQFWSLHVGVVASPGWLLHTEKETEALLVWYKDGHGINRRINGFWRNIDATRVGGKPSVQES